MEKNSTGKEAREGQTVVQFDLGGQGRKASVGRAQRKAGEKPC